MLPVAHNGQLRSTRSGPYGCLGALRSFSRGALVRETFKDMGRVLRLSCFHWNRIRNTDRLSKALIVGPLRCNGCE